MKKAAGTALLIGLLLVGAMSRQGTGGAAARSRPESVDSRLVEATDQFSIALLKEVHAQHPDESLFLSPLSAQVILSLTANGARGRLRRRCCVRWATANWS